jgi:hypothetical protein
MPSWDKVVDIARIYLIYCDCQPLPLFHRQTFLNTLNQRDPEIIYAVLGLALRFCPQPLVDDLEDISRTAASYTEAARERVTRLVLGGPVEISTLQSLCLLSLIEFSSMAHFDIVSTLSALLTSGRWEYPSSHDTQRTRSRSS